MTHPNMIILYVDSPANSVRFYTDLLNTPPLEASPTFAMFALDSGVMLGLWSKHTVEPASSAAGGGGELAFSATNNEEVDILYASWSQRGLEMVQTPTHLDFGYTFVAADPDGHRLRVFAPAEE
ncbi:VOC family protein [Brenneria goodwinii]|uniref:VOC family protein n=1 Tax=Brenneria goodwinii TaxID=1109412 RepID=UPI0036E646BB